MNKSQASMFVLISLLLFSPLPTEQGIVTGAICFKTCAGVCCAIGAWEFGRQTGIPLDITGCCAMCMVACANQIALPGICYSNETIFLDDSMHPINAGSVQNGDLIQTLSLVQGKWIMTPTKVKLAIEIEGPINFVRIHLQQPTANSSTILTVTEDHRLIILDEMSGIGIGEGKAILTQSSSDAMMKTIPAKIIQIGNKMIGLTFIDAIDQTPFFQKTGIGNADIWIVEKIEFVELPQRYVIQTEAGTALASNLLTSTSCIHGDD